MDLALANIGWAIYNVIFDEETREHLCHDLIMTGTFENPKVSDNAMADLTFRCEKAFEFIDHIIKEEIVQVIVERPYGARNTKAASCMGACAAICAYIKRQIDIDYVEPMEMKKYIRSFMIFPPTKDPKKLALFIARKLRYEDKPEHETDALCIYHTYLARQT